MKKFFCLVISLVLTQTLAIATFCEGEVAQLPKDDSVKTIVFVCLFAFFVILGCVAAIIRNNRNNK